jgi:phosphoribosylformylglycinamidine synthase
MYVIGETTHDKQFTFISANGIDKPIDLQLEDMFGNPPQTILQDKTKNPYFQSVEYDIARLGEYIRNTLQIEAVACKDYLTNKVDRSVTGKIAKQQCAGMLQLPLNNLGAVTIDYSNNKGIATAIGHAPVAGLTNPVSGSVLSIAEALTNIIWAPLLSGLKGVSLSANWMWPCKNPGENARLYKAVQAASDFAIALGINIPTGKDSLSMSQKYPEGTTVLAPGTVIISAAAEVTDITKIIEPVLQNEPKSKLLYIDLSRDDFLLGGSSFAQTINRIGDEVPLVTDPDYFLRTFNQVQQLINERKILAGHDVSAGGLITCLLEMTFANLSGGMELDFSRFEETDLIKILFSENPALVIQVSDEDALEELNWEGIEYYVLGKPMDERKMYIKMNDFTQAFDIDEMRDTWYKTSYLLDQQQSGRKKALERFTNYKKQPLDYIFNDAFKGTFNQYNINPRRTDKTSVRAAIIREKGVNGDREMAWNLYLAGMDVKDVHMTDLITGRETLEDINMIVFVGGFSNSDVLGSAKGWAGAFLYNKKAKTTLETFYKRDDTLSLGICNGCQLMIELGLLTPDHDKKPTMRHNDSHKFESAFLGVDVLQSNSVMLRTLAGSRLGIWIAHGEGKFSFPYNESHYNIAVKYAYNEYPGNPNGSDYNVAGICSGDGRHLAMMPHLERAAYPWNWAYYPQNRNNDEITPWVEAFVNAREWIKEKTGLT